MKTSKKILIFIAGFTLIALVVVLVLLRIEIKAALKAENKPFEEVSLGRFTHIRFSSNWQVKIRQGLRFKVRLASKEAAILKPKLTVKGDTLYMNIPPGKPGTLEARLLVPAFMLKALEAKGNAQVYLYGYQSDTLRVAMQDHSVFTGKDNKVSQLDFTTSGQARIQLSSK